jgi:hypothetical protein
MHHSLHFTLSSPRAGKPSTATPFSPVAFAALTLGVSQMNTIDLSNMEAFLEYCDSIDLSAYSGATITVGSEVTGVIGEE